MNPDTCRVRLTQLLEQWDVVSSGEPLLTHASCLLPGERNSQPVMLKTSQQPDEIRGFALLDWWNGNGAVRVFERTHDAILMERATGEDSLVALSAAGNDDVSIAIICQVLDRLHSANAVDIPELVTLDDWFGSLFESTASDGFMQRGRQCAFELLEQSDPPFALHGDLHHGNVVRMENGEWRAIDPQGLCGPRAYDYANIFRNPNLVIAADPSRFRARLSEVSACSGIERAELLRWIMALCALSHSWGEDTELPANTDRIIADLALAHLDALADG